MSDDEEETTPLKKLMAKSVHASGISVTLPSGGSTVSSGTWVSTGTGTWGSPMPAHRTISGGMLTASPAPPPKPVELVELPKKMTRKVLVVFLEENGTPDDDIVWAKNLVAEDISIDYDFESGVPEMTLRFKMIDKFNNEEH